MPFTIQQLHSCEIYFSDKGVAIKQGHAFVVLPHWQLASILSRSLERTRGSTYEGQFGINLNETEVEELMALAKQAEEDRLTK